MTDETNAKWHITDTLAVDVQVIGVNGPWARVRRGERELTVRTAELDLEAA